MTIVTLYTLLPKMKLSNFEFVLGLYATSSQVLAQTSDNVQPNMLNYHSQMNHLARRNYYNWNGWNG